MTAPRGTIRDAVAADTDAIRSIYIEASVAAVGAAANAAAIHEAAAGRHAMWGPLARPRPRQGVRVFADDGGVVRAFVSFGPAHDDPRGAGHIYALYVTPDHWGHGVGSRLLAAAIDDLRRAGMTAVELWVQDENVRARAFYERHGWRFTGDERANARGNFLRYATPSEHGGASPT